MTFERDGDASILGRLGLGNELVTWLIGRGHGDYVQMLPSEIESYQKRSAPRCRRAEGGRRCDAPMKSRGRAWVCYFHEPPERLQDEPLKPLYASGRIEDHIGDVVDMEYSREPGERVASWKTWARKF